jgi:hypothetical protein
VLVCVNDPNIHCIFLVNFFVHKLCYFGAPKTSWVKSTQHRERYIRTGQFFLNQTEMSIRLYGVWLSIHIGVGGKVT